jgi:hypothetical protein
VDHVRKKNEKKRKRNEKKEQKGKDANAELRRRTKARAIAYYTEEAEYYLKEREYHEEQYDDEQCAYYYQNYIEEMPNDRPIRKRLYQRSQPARTARHSRWEKEMQLRRKQKEEKATEVQVITYETEQHQQQKIYKRRRTTRRGRR